MCLSFLFDKKETAIGALTTTFMLVTRESWLVMFQNQRLSNLTCYICKALPHSLHGCHTFENRQRPNFKHFAFGVQLYRSSLRIRRDLLADFPSKCPSRWPPWLQMTCKFRLDLQIAFYQQLIDCANVFGNGTKLDVPFGLYFEFQTFFVPVSYLAVSAVGANEPWGPKP